MNRVAAAAVVLVSSLALAQEIGKEIPSDQAGSAGNNTASYDNPYAPPPVAPAADEAAPADAPRGVPGPRRLALGLRAQLGGSSAGLGAPTIGVSFLITERIGLSLDFGAGLKNEGDFGFGLKVGGDVRLGSNTKPIRPLLALGVGIGKNISTRSDDLLLDFSLGGGAEFWFSDHFSVSGRALIDFPVDLKTGDFQVMTITPGIGGTFYF